MFQNHKFRGISELLPWPGFSNQLFIEYDSGVRFFTVLKKARRYESSGGAGSKKLGIE